jgi:hypothetical protein
MARTIEDTPTSPYAVLGVSRHATAGQIKHAYRRKAKAAHPDAGGSVTAMAKINAAYRTLSDPDARRAYDAAGGAPSAGYTAAGSAGRPATEGYPPESEPVTHPRGAKPFSQNEAEYIQRQRTRWARNSAWELLRFSLPAAAAGVILQRFAPTYVTSTSNLLAVGFLTFAPAYLLMLSLVFLVDPPLRLIFADLVRGHHTTREERITALAIVLAYFPLAGIWAFWGLGYCIFGICSVL